MKTILVSINARFIHAGLAVRQLLCACRESGLCAEMLECDINQNAEAIVRRIARMEPDAVGFCCYIWNIDLVGRVSRALKLACPKTVILWGGPEVSYNAKRRLDENACLSAVLCGEGEIALPRTLRQLEANEEMRGPGVVTRLSDGGIAPLMDAEQWIDVYKEETHLDPHRLWYLETVRGCPYGCRYCLSSAIAGLRALDAQEAIKRLLHLRDAGAAIIKLVDRTFNFDRARARAIWRALLEKGQGATYHFEIAANLLEQEDIDLLSVAPEGLFQLEIGVQTTTRAALLEVGRTLEFEKIAWAVEQLCRRTHVPVHMDLIAGLPQDSLDSFASSFDDVLALHPNRLQLGFLKLLHGSALRQDFDAGAGVYSPDAPYEVIATGQMSYRDLSLLKDVEEVVETFYNTHAFPATQTMYLTCFADFVSVAERLRDNGFFAEGQGELARFSHLFSALKPRCGEEALLENCLRYDWLHDKKRLVRPDFMDDEQPEMQQMLRARCDSVTQRRHRQVEKFLYDVHTGQRQEQILFFDYALGTETLLHQG